MTTESNGQKEAAANRNPVVGCLFGTAVADALGLPYEGLSRRRGRRLYGVPDRYRFCFGRGMVSDDTEHTCIAAQALLASQGEVALFRTDLARRLRWWLLGVPAGIGLATLRSLLRLWFGRNPERSGVYSAGNGPAMRAAILGAALDDLDTLRDFAQASTRITHTDPKAEYGALAIALAAWQGRHGGDTEAFLLQLQEWFGEKGEELIGLLTQAIASAHEGQSTEAFADSLGLSQGVSGYVYHTVPVAIHAWLRHPGDFRAAVTAVISCGGDTDSTGAIVGGILGTSVGREGIPTEWLQGLLEWPRSPRWMERLGEQFPAGSRSPLRLPFYGILLRNVFFLFVVLFHGFRRLFPPY